MKLRELGTVIILIALAMGFFAAHELSHHVSDAHKAAYPELVNP